MSSYQTAALGLRGVAKTLVGTAPATRAEFLLGVRSPRLIDTLFVFALLILPMLAFVAVLFLLSNGEPATAMPSAVDAAMLILPP
jgi:hypothetical protein